METDDEPLLQAGGTGGLLALPNRVQEDCKIIRRAIREGWPVPLERRQRILTTLQQIVETDTFEIEKIVHEQGPDKTSKEVKTESIKAPNHKNQIAAAKAILAAAQLDQQDAHHVEAHNQRERHHADDLQVAKANAMSNAANAGLIPNKTYLGLDPGKV